MDKKASGRDKVCGDASVAWAEDPPLASSESVPCVISVVGNKWLCLSQTILYQSVEDRASGAMQLEGSCPDSLHVVAGFIMGLKREGDRAEKTNFIEACQTGYSSCSSQSAKWGDILFMVCGKVGGASVVPKNERNTDLPVFSAVTQTAPATKRLECPAESTTMQFGLSFALSDADTIAEVIECGGLGSNRKCPPSKEDLHSGKVMSIAFCGPRTESFQKFFSIHASPEVTVKNCPKDGEGKCKPSLSCAFGRNSVAGAMFSSDLSLIEMCPTAGQLDTCMMDSSMALSGKPAFLFLLCSADTAAEPGPESLLS
uniref:Uncharacterized protein n=1 Tax=Chromera velia CCMP2878 TaxID=1169474 RepID=A0A0G4GS10_9ALVE|eukprot:Cvel_5123.t1-p1 / transcript=Cvel_5123.t1 / gene=Cvel_5123 / organism=Chromera_velia_CCMP2878 / gene_product=hypothetical protein / transcript_product=hypothetical protein / location=Cvel_scaffold234:50013-53835(+) / protein_length=313 / sequence_SO=supercontig / SO=protein_coding / is_pseudo=false